jgi:hypothetical protein
MYRMRAGCGSGAWPVPAEVPCDSSDHAVVSDYCLFNGFLSGLFQILSRIVPASEHRRSARLRARSCNKGKECHVGLMNLLMQLLMVKDPFMCVTLAFSSVTEGPHVDRRQAWLTIGSVVAVIIPRHCMYIVNAAI